MKYILNSSILFALLLTLTACGQSGSHGSSAAASAENPELENPGNFTNYAKLPWENGKNRSWSLFLYEQIEKNSDVFFKGANDVAQFCPNYYSLNRQEQTEFWAQLLVQMIKYESNYNPVLRFKEPGSNVDPITGQSVYSEGLLQLSYQDTQWMPACKFDWKKDKMKLIADPLRTILDPYNNLHCGVLIMKRQLTKHKTIAISTGAYWAVIKTNSTYNKLPQIKAGTKALAYCQR